MPKIRFLCDELYECDGRNKGPKFAQGETILATEAFANRWTRRGVAEEIGKGEPKGDAPFERVKSNKPEVEPEKLTDERRARIAADTQALAAAADKAAADKAAADDAAADKAAADPAKVGEGDGKLDLGAAG